MNIELGNSALRVSVRPDLGGRIDQITDMTNGKEWLWHPSSYDASQSRSLPVGASFDRNWTGGWEEVFPNDAAGLFQGRNLVDHGELWSQSWHVVERNERGVKMALQCQTVPIMVEKTVFLAESDRDLRVQYLVKNQSSDTIPFLFKLHPAIAIEEGDELLLPECEVEPVELGFSRIIGRNGKTRFPYAVGADGNSVRLDRMLPASTEGREFFYCSELRDGECGLRNPRTGSQLHLSFSQSQFPYVWTLMSFGGFEGHYVLLLEPCTTKPYDLAAAWQQGTVAILSGNTTREFEVRLRISSIS